MGEQVKWLGAGNFYLKRGGYLKKGGPGEFYLKGGGYLEKGGGNKIRGAGHPTGTMGSHCWLSFRSFLD